MNIMDLLKDAGADAGIGAMSKQIGLSSGDAGKLIAALSPALTRGLQRQSGDDGDLSALRRALETGGHQRYVQEPELMAKEETRLDGNKILGHLFGSKDVSRNVAAHAAEETGLSSSLIKKALPMLATLLMGAVSKGSNSGRELTESSGGGALGSIAGMFLNKGSNSGIDDVINLARKFF